MNKMKPYGWGIVDKDGNPYLSPDGAVKNPKYLLTTIQYLNGELVGEERSSYAPVRVVQLFYKDDSSD